MNEDVREQIRNLEIFSKRLMNSDVPGDYISAFKGAGFEFEQMREYCDGDDVRLINWNATAKTGNLMVKETIPERDRTVILAVDCSSSSNYSSKKELKKDLMQKFCAALGFIAANGGDRVGALIFSDTVERWFSPQRGHAHLAQINEAIAKSFEKGGKTNFVDAFKYLVDLKKRNSILFMVSDFIEPVVDKTDKSAIHMERLLRLLACEYDMIATRVTDDCEERFPDVGMISIVDPETGEEILVDSASSAVKKLAVRMKEQKSIFERSGADVLDLRVGRDMARTLAEFFHKRISRQV
jgi:uncharacterized protein (DUF58 family)